MTYLLFPYFQPAQVQQGHSDVKSWEDVYAIAIEGMFRAKTGHSVTISRQHLTDCCTGASVDSCVRSMTTFCTDKSYHSSFGCEATQCASTVSVESFKQIAASKEALKEAVDSQPVLAFVNANHPSFINYQRGVFAVPSCSAAEGANHPVLVVGHGYDGPHPYWLVSLSHWGDLAVQTRLTIVYWSMRLT